MALVALLFRLPFYQGPRSFRRRAWIGIALLGVTGLDIIPAAFGWILQSGGMMHAVLASIDWWNEQADGFLSTALWAIHYLAGLVTCMTAFLLLWEAARQTASLYPDIAEAALGLGAALLAAEELPTAIAEFQRVLRIDPDHAEARYLLGCAWLEAGEAEPALAAFAPLADMPGLAGRIAEAEAIKARPRSDAGYVRHLFDQFSTDYDARMLGTLSYRAPMILRELAAAGLCHRVYGGALPLSPANASLTERETVVLLK